MSDREGEKLVVVFDYMTVIPGRRVQTKVHRTLGQAKNAILGVGRRCGTSSLYERHGTQWVPLYTIDKDVPDGDMPWKTEGRESITLTYTQSRQSRRTLYVTAPSYAEAKAMAARGEWSMIGQWSEAVDGEAYPNG